MSKLPQTNFYQNIRAILENARKKVAISVNSAMIEAYWNVGRMIIEEEQGGKVKAVYGEKLLKNLSNQLTKDFGKGFGLSNLKYFRKFYSLFPKGHAVRDQLSWTHYRLLLKVEDKKAREFYLSEAAEEHWSTRTLERQINSFYYQRLLASQNKDSVIKEAKDKAIPLQPSDLIKDPYVLEFLQLKDVKDLHEKDLETALLDKLQIFLLELGKGFSFVARQKRFSADNDHFYIDLVFYNYLLKCFVLIDLKIGKLTHQDIGQLDFYVRYWEDQFKPKGDNPTIGIILCSEKNETIVKYSVLKDSQHLFASKYMLYLPSEEELRLELERELEEIRLLNKIEKEK